MLYRQKKDTYIRNYDALVADGFIVKGETETELNIADDLEYQDSILAPDFIQHCDEAQFNPERRLCGVGISSCCMVRNANESPTGDPLEINRHFCAVAQKNKEIVLEWREKHLRK